ncbi:hypothetical protein LCGC14_1533400, partial [marine sediment metagenome]
GNHTASEDLNIQDFDIVNVTKITSSSGSYINYESNGNVEIWI